MTSAPTSYSVVIPTHDTCELTLRCLDSLRGHGDLDVVVVDDGSSDDTAAQVCRRHPGARVLRNEGQVGFTASANRGLAAARGRVLVLLNSDTEVAPDAFFHLTEALRAAPRLGVAGGRLHYPDGAPQWSGGSTPGAPWCFALASGLPVMLRSLSWLRGWLRPPRGSAPGPVDWVTGAAMVIRREVWESIGPLDERFEFYCQDLDFCVRAKEAGWQVRVVPGFRVMHHHGATVSGHGAGVDHSAPERLWTDLVRWAAKHRGRAGARRVATALVTGARLRLGLRALIAPFLQRDRRRAWRRGSMLYRRALTAVQALRAVDPADQPG